MPNTVDGPLCLMSAKNVSPKKTPGWPDSSRFPDSSKEDSRLQGAGTPHSALGISKPAQRKANLHCETFAGNKPKTLLYESMIENALSELHLTDPVVQDLK